MALIGDLDRAALAMDEAIDDASTSAHHPQLETFMTKGALIHLVKNVSVQPSRPLADVSPYKMKSN